MSEEPPQSNPADNKVIMGHLVRLHAKTLTPGSIQNRCQDCGDAVWLSPSSMIAEGKILCCVCFAKLLREDEEMEPRTNEVQRQEIKDAGADIDPEDPVMLRALVSWECFMAQSPREAKDFHSEKFFWAFAKRLKAGTFGITRTNGIKLGIVYEYASTEEAFKGLESIFLDGKDEPDGYVARR